MCVVPATLHLAPVPAPVFAAQATKEDLAQQQDAGSLPDGNSTHMQHRRQDAIPQQHHEAAEQEDAQRNRYYDEWYVAGNELFHDFLFLQS